MAERKTLTTSMFHSDVVRLQHFVGLQSYAQCLAQMEETSAAISQGKAPEALWLLEHEAVFTAGTSAKPADLLWPDRFPVFETGRGGQYTYHGPGQRIAYVMLDLKKRGGDVRAFVAALERWIISTLADFGIVGETREDRVGVWVARPGREDKIAALGIRVRHGTTMHGIAINLAPDLSHFLGIVPCGVQNHGVTSFADLGHPTKMAALDECLTRRFQQIFAPLE
jgi:lipoyl(octanoyl) transferase